MRIVILANHFPPRWLGGSEIAAHYLAEHLSRRGHDVHVITHLDEGLAGESDENGFHVHRLPRPAIRLAGAFVFWMNTFGTIRRIRPDIVHSQSLGVAVSALISKRVLKIPYVVWGQGSDVHLPDWSTNRFSRTVIKNADAAIALTEDMRQAMRARYEREIAIVPNGIELGDRRTGLSMQKTGGFERRIICVGRLYPVKGIQYLIQAMARIHGEMPGARLTLVGDGTERGELEDLVDRLGVRECVTFTGRVPHEEVRGYLDRADVFVLPSLSEGLPLTILEAMASGLPIVATKVGGVPDIVDEGMNGYLVEPRNPDEIADRVSMLLRNDVVRDEISARNRKKAEQFGWDEIAGALERVYESAIGCDPDSVSRTG
jgi:glycosyltransferase involved in cell wall biosynthesis